MHNNAGPGTGTRPVASQARVLWLMSYPILESAVAIAVFTGVLYSLNQYLNDLNTLPIYRSVFHAVFDMG